MIPTYDETELQRERVNKDALHTIVSLLAIELRKQDEAGETWVAQSNIDGLFEAEGYTPGEAVGNLLHAICTEAPEILARRLETLYG